MVSYTRTKQITDSVRPAWIMDPDRVTQGTYCGDLVRVPSVEDDEDPSACGDGDGARNGHTDQRT